MRIGKENHFMVACRAFFDTSSTARRAESIQNRVAIYWRLQRLSPEKHGIVSRGCVILLHPCSRRGPPSARRASEHDQP